MARKKKRDGNGADKPAEAAIGHNRPELTEDEKRVLLYQHKGSYAKANDAVKQAKAELLRVCKLAKTECGKDAVADIKTLILLDDPKGAEAMKADIERNLRLARWANSKVGHQFHFDDFDGTPAVDHARELGKTAGLKGEPKKPPYDASLPQYNAWCDGWNDGQAVLCSNFRSKLETGGTQIDLAERGDLPPESDLPRADVSDPPFAVPADDSIPEFIKRTPDAPAMPN